MSWEVLAKACVAMATYSVFCNRHMQDMTNPSIRSKRRSSQVYVALKGKGGRKKDFTDDEWVLLEILSDNFGLFALSKYMYPIFFLSIPMILGIMFTIFLDTDKLVGCDDFNPDWNVVVMTKLLPILHIFPQCYYLVFKQILLEYSWFTMLHQSHVYS